MLIVISHSNDSQSLYLQLFPFWSTRLVHIWTAIIYKLSVYIILRYYGLGHFVTCDSAL